jgi:transposase
MRYELTDDEWTAVKPMLPNKPSGVPRVNDRRVLNGIFRGGVPLQAVEASRARTKRVTSMPCPSESSKLVTIGWRVATKPARRPRQCVLRWKRSCKIRLFVTGSPGGR